MASNKETGKKGEELAATWLEGLGFSLIEQNWRTGRYEIDIIGVRCDVLHFFEVKTSRQQRFGYPEERVHRKKLGHFVQAGGAYLELHPQWQKVQYDIIAIQLLQEQSPRILLIEDVYCIE